MVRHGKERKMIQMTKAEALDNQHKQLVHYTGGELSHPLWAMVAAATTADLLDDGVPYPVWEINKHVPRGTSMESMLMEIKYASGEAKPAGGGDIYYSEMGQRPDESTLFHAEYVWRKYSLRWAVGRDAEARAAFKAHRIRPGEIEATERRGQAVMQTMVTWAAYEKLSRAKLTVTSVLLD